MHPTPNKIFGTDGVRGRANIEPVTAETALQLGRAAAHVFKDLNPESRSREKHRIVIGKDTRLSGYMLENALASGILSMGVDVLFIGPLPTPGVARTRGGTGSSCAGSGATARRRAARRAIGLATSSGRNAANCSTARAP